jgi:hypothetical protein
MLPLPHPPRRATMNSGDDGDGTIRALGFITNHDSYHLS